MLFRVQHPDGSGPYANRSFTWGLDNEWEWEDMYSRHNDDKHPAPYEDNQRVIGNFACPNACAFLAWWGADLPLILTKLQVIAFEADHIVGRSGLQCTYKNSHNYHEIYRRNSQFPG